MKLDCPGPLRGEGGGERICRPAKRDAEVISKDPVVPRRGAGDFVQVCATSLPKYLGNKERLSAVSATGNTRQAI